MGGKTAFDQRKIDKLLGETLVSQNPRHHRTVSARACQGALKKFSHMTAKALEVQAHSMVCLNGCGYAKHPLTSVLLHRSIHVASPQFDQVISGDAIRWFLRGADFAGNFDLNFEAYIPLHGFL